MALALLVRLPQACQQEAGSKAELPGFELVPFWDADIVDGGLAPYVIKPGYVSVGEGRLMENLYMFFSILL